MGKFSPPLQNVVVEILINNVWTNISQYVYTRDGITITGGRSTTSDKPQPATCSLTVNNADSRFTPSNVSGPYYPFLTVNVQLRVSVAAISSSGNTYSGYRFWGSVAAWPPQSNVPGTDVYAQISATGPLRQLSTGGGRGSALARYYNSLTGLNAPIAYWPCEEQPGTEQIQSALLAGQQMSISGTPLWMVQQNGFDGSLPVGVLNKSTWTGNTGSFVASGDDVFTIGGSYLWTAPVSTITTVRCWGAGGGGEGAGAGESGAGGGGGEFASDSSVAVVAGQQYQVIVGSGGGAGQIALQPGGNGSRSRFAGTSVATYASGGQGGGQGGNGVGGSGGSGSSSGTHFSGGNGGAWFTNPTTDGGGGGGSSGGTASAGNNGSAGTSTLPGAGGNAVTNGGAGGAGGNPGGPGASGGTPGGGGGGGGYASGTQLPGGNGADGKVELIYTPPAAPTAVACRFLVAVPVHGAKNGQVLARFLTGGTVARLDVVYLTGGSIRLDCYNATPTLLGSTSSLSASLNGGQIMVSVEQTPSGTSVVNSLTAIVAGAKQGLGTVSFTATSASMGNVTQVIAGPNGDITKTAMGHFSVQYAIIPLVQVSDAMAAHTTELTVDRFIRLLAEEAMGAEAVYSEGSNHWGFQNPQLNANSFFVPGQSPWTTANNATAAIIALGSFNVSLVSPPPGGQALQFHGDGVTGSPQIVSEQFAVSPSTNYAGFAWALSAAGYSSVQLVLAWYTSGHVLISTSAGPVINVPSNTLTGLFSGINTSPSNAAFGQIVIRMNSTPASSVLLAVTGVNCVSSQTATDSATASAGMVLNYGTPQPQGWPTETQNSIGNSWVVLSSGSAPSINLPGSTTTTPVLPGDVACAAVDVCTPAAKTAMRLDIQWYTSGGSLISTSLGTAEATINGQILTMVTTAVAPATAAYFGLVILDNENVPGSTWWAGNVRVCPAMGKQQVKALDELIQEIHVLEAGMYADSRHLFGLKFRTRISILNQSPAITLNYAQGMVANDYGGGAMQAGSGAPGSTGFYAASTATQSSGGGYTSPIAPMPDTVLITNRLTIRRLNGSQVTVGNPGSASPPPAGIGKRHKAFKVVAALDQQLDALASHLLTIGTGDNVRYPVISVNMLRAGVPGNAFAPLMSAAAGVDIGDYVAVSNLPSYFSASTVKQLVIGYSELIDVDHWAISWNCVPESPYEISSVSLRRW